MAGATRTASPAGDGSFRDLEIRYARLARADHRLVELLGAEDEPARERWFAELAAAGDVELAWLVGIHIEYLSWPGRERDAARAARLLTDPDRPVWQRANGFVSLGSLALREGRWREARAQLDSLAAIDPVRAALWRADWASSSFLPLPAAELRSIRSELATILETADFRPPEGLPVGPVGWTTTPPAGPEVWGLARLSALSARLGDFATADAYSNRLAAQPSLREAALGTLAEDLRRGLRAEALRQRGDRAGARAALDSPRYEVRWDGLSAGLYPQLFLRAELLHASGELEEAERWYALWMHLTGSRFLGPVLRRLGQIHEARDEPEQALSRYEEFVTLWRNADEELQPWVADARRRIRGPARASNARPLIARTVPTRGP